MSRPRAKLTNNFPGCPVESTLNFLDGKWKGVILYHLFDGARRNVWKEPDLSVESVVRFVHVVSSITHVVVFKLLCYR